MSDTKQLIYGLQLGADDMSFYYNHYDGCVIQEITRGNEVVIRNVFTPRQAVRLATSILSSVDLHLTIDKG